MLMPSLARHKPHIVIAGAGFGGIYTYIHLHRLIHDRKRPKAAITIVNEENFFLFTPLLHEVATGGLSPTHVVQPLRSIARCCVDQILVQPITHIDHTKQIIQTPATEVPYDALLIASGSTTNFYNVPGAETHCLTLKTLHDAIHIKHRILDAFENALHLTPEERRAQLTFVLVGGGPTGVELAGELSDFIGRTLKRYYPSHMLKETRVILLQKQPELIPLFPKSLRTNAKRILERTCINVRLNADVVRMTSQGVELRDGEFIPSETVIWVAGVKPNMPPLTHPLPQDPRGALLVDDTFRVQETKNVFAIGDVAGRDPELGPGWPVLAQAATAQSRIAAQNLWRTVMKQKPLKSFTYHHKGSLASLGRWSAVAALGPFRFSGAIAWWIWRTIYWTKFISWRRRIEIGVEWLINSFQPRDITRIR
jgi:NADH:ubiquinone reductase (H+-translocating)